MEENQRLKNVLENLLREGVDIEIIVKSSGLTTKEIEEFAPVSYATYSATKKERSRIARNLLRSGMKVERVAKVTGLMQYQVQIMKDKKQKAPPKIV